MYYVGQAKKLFFRINQHFTGHGNGDVYADYKAGNSFKMMIIPLADSGYKDIDLLEKDMIKKYRAYECGYNKTKGNDEVDAVGKMHSGRSKDLPDLLTTK